MATKTSTLILLASLAANAALVAVVALREPSLFGPGLGDAGVPVKPRAVPTAVPPQTLGGSPGAQTWAALKADDLASMIARLRSAGFPPDVIRAIAKAQLDEKYRARRSELVAQDGPRPYWSRRYQGFDPKTYAALTSISREETKELNALLGPDEGVNPFLGVAVRPEGTAGLSREKYDRIQAINADFSDMMGGVFGGANGFMLPEDQEKMDYLRKEQQSEIAAELSPDEFFEYQLRTSNSAGQLRWKLSAFNATEDEFRELFKVQQDFDSQYGSTDGLLTPDQIKEREAHQPDLLAKVQDTLGPDRAADYKVKTDQSYIDTNRLVERLELPAATTQQVVSVQNDITKRADAIRKDPTLSAADRSAQLSALADEATGEITAVMGERGMAAYKQYNAGWMQSLRPQAK